VRTVRLLKRTETNNNPKGCSFVFALPSPRLKQGEMADLLVFQPVPSTSGTVAGAGQAAEANRNEQRPGDVTGDFEKRRDAARRQSSYCRRRRLGQITVAVVVSVPDLTAAALRRGLLGSAGATREDLERIAAVIIAEAMRR
jgi:hypothetical protein